MRPEILFGVTADDGFDAPVDFGHEVGHIFLLVSRRLEAERFGRDHPVLEEAVANKCACEDRRARLEVQAGGRVDVAVAELDGKDEVTMVLSAELA